MSCLAIVTFRFSFVLVFFVSGLKFGAKGGNEEVTRPALLLLKSVSADHPERQSGRRTYGLLLPPAGV